MKPQRVRVLICDFDAEILMQLEQTLENAGFDTTTTWDPADFARLAQGGTFDLLILGDHPPLINAEVIVTELRRKHRQLSGALLVWQRQVKQSDVERLRSAGATAVVSGRDYSSIVEQVKFYSRSANFVFQQAG